MVATLVNIVGCFIWFSVWLVDSFVQINVTSRNFMILILIIYTNKYYENNNNNSNFLKKLNFQLAGCILFLTVTQLASFPMGSYEDLSH